MEEKYQLKEGCLTIQMPKELDHHEAGRLKMEADFLIAFHFPLLQEKQVPRYSR